MGFEPVEAGVAQLRDHPLPDLDEFTLVRMQGTVSASENEHSRGPVGESFSRAGAVRINCVTVKL